MDDRIKENLFKILTEMIPKMEPIPTEQQTLVITHAIEQAYVQGMCYGVKSSLDAIKEGLMKSCFNLEEFSNHLETHLDIKNP